MTEIDRLKCEKHILLEALKQYQEKGCITAHFAYFIAQTIHDDKERPETFAPQNVLRDNRDV